MHFLNQSLSKDQQNPVLSHESIQGNESGTPHRAFDSTNDIDHIGVVHSPMGTIGFFQRAALVVRTE